MDGSILVFIGIALVMYFLYNLYHNRGRKALLKKKREAYIKAIKSGDKTKALDAGRDFYSFKRKGRLTIYDEQAINNDLSIMK